jgi:hypothetical protein
MLKVLIYGYSIGLRSSRMLERACKRDEAFRVLAHGLKPGLGDQLDRVPKPFIGVPPSGHGGSPVGCGRAGQQSDAGQAPEQQG